jgi:hypothetical protein
LVQAEKGGALSFSNPPESVLRLGEIALQRLSSAFQVGSPTNHSLTSPPLYLRLDIIETAAGPYLSECEGVEPELFMRAKPGSEKLFSEAIQNRILSKVH